MISHMLSKRTFRLLPYDNDTVFASFRQNVSLVRQTYARQCFFTSDSLPNTNGMAYDAIGKHLLVFNVSGNAYLYPTQPELQPKLFPRLKLHKREGSGESTVAFFDKWCFYINTDNHLCRLDMVNGTFESIPELETTSVYKMIQVQDKLYLFLRKETESITVEEYTVQNGTPILQRDNTIPDFTYIFDIKMDYDKKTPVLSAEPKGSHMPQLVTFDAASMTFHPLNIPNWTSTELFLGFHTYLEKDLAAFAYMSGVEIVRISSGKIEAKSSEDSDYENPKKRLLQCCDVLFTGESDGWAVLVASWNGLYHWELESAIISSLGLGGIDLFNEDLFEENVKLITKHLETF